MMLRIPVDFNAMNTDGTQVWINTNPAINPRLAETLQYGMKVILFEAHDIQVEAIVTSETDSNGRVFWYGIPDWNTLVDLT